MKGKRRFVLGLSGKLSVSVIYLYGESSGMAIVKFEHSCFFLVGLSFFIACSLLCAWRLCRVFGGLLELRIFLLFLYVGQQKSFIC